ncbi:EamA family transporter [Deltaproteobacteria bacterium Smac51]|nr:EamA family transporter [Deltaproteobacteria bacterium Smac51]
MHPLLNQGPRPKHQYSDNTMSQTAKGILYIILSAVLFGLMPILVKLTVEGGSNGLNATFFRGLIGLPIMLAVLRLRGIPATFSASEWKTLSLTFGVGAAVTITLLYLSYAYIPVGVATSLHFIYPAAVTLAYVLFFKARPKAVVWLALAACLAGVFVLGGNISDIGQGLPGIIMALASGLTFTCYFIGLDKTELKYMPFHKLTFALCLITSLSCGILGLLTGQLTLELTFQAWVCTVMLSVLTTLGAAGLLQRGIQLTDGTTAAILSTFEPITSFMFAAAILGEAITSSQLLGCGFIVMSVILLTSSKVKTKSG